jgi:predicted nucleic acid-binding protein
MAEYVFDTEPLIAYVYDEPGADHVQSLLEHVDAGGTTAAISEVTATEIVYKIARLRADGRPDQDDLAVGQQQVRSFVAGGIDLASPTASWEIAAEVKAHGGVALGDAFAVGLAVEQEATLIIGADRDFDDLPVEATTERIRTDPA